MDTEIREETERDGAIAYLAFLVDEVHTYFFNVTFSREWKTWDLEEQLAFRNAIEALFAVGSLHRETFDSEVWKGHSDGTVNPLVTSIRKQREGDAPGKKAEPVTPQSLLAKRLKK